MMNRTAENLFWIGRYLERAKNHTRMIDIHYHERGVLQDCQDHCIWERLISSIGDVSLFNQLFSDMNETSVLTFLTFSERNPNSLLSCITKTRNNVRSLRQLLPSELWDRINGLYHWMNGQDMSTLMAQSPYMFYQRFREWLSLISGTADATMMRDLVWDFLQTGKFFERAENLLRNLESYLTLTQDSLAQGHHANYNRFIILLKSAGGYEAYRKLYADRVTLAKVIEFLLLEPGFPYSVKYSLGSLEFYVTRIKEQDDRFARLLDKALAVFSGINTTLNELKGYSIGLELIQAMLESINRLGMEISNKFFQEGLVTV